MAYYKESIQSGSAEDHPRLWRQDMPPQFHGDLQKLLDFPILRPRTEFPFLLTQVTTHLSEIGQGWYLLTGIRPPVHDGLPADTIRACMILWARNISTAVLASGCQDFHDNPKSRDNELPPVQVFISSATGWTYGEILRAERCKVVESAVYGADGEFLYRRLRLNRIAICFSSRKRKVMEIPIAISLTPPPK